MSFRQPLSTLVTASDASEEGGGVCRSAGLTANVDAFVRQALRANQGIALGQCGLVETLSGIGGARRALEVLGNKPASFT